MQHRVATVGGTHPPCSIGIARSRRLEYTIGSTNGLFGFTLARANARMLINAASKRSSAKNAVRTSRSRSASSATEFE